MVEPITARNHADLHSIVANPASSPRQAVVNGIRLCGAVAGLDVVQTIVAGAAAWLAFPKLPVNLSQALGLAAFLALLAALVRRAMRPVVPLLPVAAEEAATRAAAAVFLAFLLVAPLCWLLLGPDAPLAPFFGWLSFWCLASAGMAAGLRYAVGSLTARLEGGTSSIAVVGNPEEVLEFSRALVKDALVRWKRIIPVDDQAEDGLDRLAGLAAGGRVETVALAVRGPDRGRRINRVCDRLADQSVRICLALDPDMLAQVPRCTAWPDGVALVDLVVNPHAGWGGTAKRITDILGAGIGLLLVAPVLAVAALAIKVETPGPVLFRQWRFGKGSRPIQVLKLRTMFESQGDATGEQGTAARDPRVTRVGRFLRRTSIDEIPQLLNVLRGDMSLVGPRPHPLHMRVTGTYYFEAVEQYRARHSVRPGITGWAQINGSRGEVRTLEQARRRVELDLWYLEHWSLALDLRIILRTIFGGFASFRAD